MQVFLSHSHRDTEAADRIDRALQRAGYTTWRVDRDVTIGGDVGVEVNQALKKSDAMVVVLSPDALESPYIEHEIGYALMNARFEHRFIPIAVRPIGKGRRTPWMQSAEPIDATHGLAGGVRRMLAALRMGRRASNHSFQGLKATSRSGRQRRVAKSAA